MCECVSERRCDGEEEYIPRWERIAAVNWVVDAVLKGGESVCELEEALTRLFERFEIWNREVAAHCAVADSRVEDS